MIVSKENKTQRPGKREEMKKNRHTPGFSAAVLLPVALIFFAGCASSGRTAGIDELENKGSAIDAPTPAWLTSYLKQGVSALQALPQYAGKYCIVGEESGVNRQFVLAWADQASAQQRIGSLLRTNIASRCQAAVNASADSGTAASGSYQQEIDNIINAVVNVSYSGARREADWWSLRRRYDPDNRAVYTDEYTAYVLYTVPKEEMNRQIALALETSVSKDSALYSATIALARDILLQGYDEKALQSTEVIERTAAASYNPPGSIVAQALTEISLLDEYMIGRATAAALLSGLRLWNGNPGLTEYVNLVCNVIVINSPSPALYNGYHVAVIDSDGINAFATSGGHIFLTRGLIAAAESEDAMAAVIAHEIAHIQLRHGLRAIKTNRGLEDWFTQFTLSGAKTIAGAINNGFSQTQEFDADITALALLAAAGYNPNGLIGMLRELEKIQGGIGGGFDTTHPSPASRLVNARIAAARYPQTKDTGSFRQKRYQAAMKGL
jgi:hypothetical protein